MRHALWISALSIVALAAWLLLREEPRRGGGAVSAAPVAPAPAQQAPRESPRDVGEEVALAPQAERPSEAEPARTAVAPDADEGSPTDPSAPSAGSERVAVAGLLRSESGGWNDLTALLGGGVVVELFDPADARATRRARLEPHAESDGSTAIAFRFDGVPPGPYRLGVTSLVAEVWEPASLPVEAPDQEIVIWCRDRVGRVRLEFDVRDEGGAPIEGWVASALRQTVTQNEGVLLQAAALEREAFPVDGRLDWSIAAPGHAPAFGDQSHFEPTAEGVWTARVALRRGWGARVVALARDPAMRPIEGARVELDGAFAGLTGVRGWLDVERAERPSELALRWGELERRIGDVRAVESAEARTRGQMLLVVLE